MQRPSVCWIEVQFQAPRLCQLANGGNTAEGEHQDNYWERQPSWPSDLGDMFQGLLWYSLTYKRLDHNQRWCPHQSASHCRACTGALMITDMESATPHVHVCRTMLAKSQTLVAGIHLFRMIACYIVRPEQCGACSQPRRPACMGTGLGPVSVRLRSRKELVQKRKRACSCTFPDLASMHRP